MSDHFIHSFTGNQARSYAAHIEYSRDGSVKKETEFQVKYRGAICQMADFAGYVPVLGTAVGVARIAASAFVAIGCLVSMGGIILVSTFCDDEGKEACYDKGIKKVYVAAQRSRDELFRGLGEIFAIPNWALEADGVASVKRGCDTLYNSRATGPVYYVNEDGDVVYPWKEYDAFNSKFNREKKEAPSAPPMPLTASAVTVTAERVHLLSKV